jgi:hypothetical protein
VRLSSAGGRDASRDRGAAQVVGVAILLGLTVISLGALAAGVGTVIEENAASADAGRVADGMAGALDPVERTGRSRETLAFTEGRLQTAHRDLRIINGTRTVRTLDVDALVWRSGDERVAFVAGAVVAGVPGRGDLHAPPPVTASRGDGGVLVVGAPRLGADGTTVSGVGGTTIPLRTNVSHDRTDLGRSEFRVAVETRTPAALATYFREQGATVGQRDIDDDGVPSVVATYPGQRRAYLVVHDLNLSIGGHSPTTPTATPADDGEANDEDGSSDGSDDGPPVDQPVPDGVPAADGTEGGDDG